MTYTPPHSLEAEAAVLGAALISERAADQTVDLLTAADFHRTAHGTLFDAVKALRDDRQTVDTVTVTERLARTGRLDEVGGASAVADLAAAPPSPTQAEHYARIVAAHARRRQVIDAARDLAIDVQAADDVETTVERHMQRLTVRRGLSTVVDNDQVAADFIARLSGDDINPSFGSGWPDVDRVWRLPKGGLTLVTGLPSSGKSTWLDVMLWQACSAHDATVAFFSPEQGPADAHLYELVRTSLGADPGKASGVDSHMGWWLDRVSWLDDAADNTPSAVLAAARRLGRDILVVDTWKDLAPDGGGRGERQDLYIQDMLRRFRRFARDTGTAVVIVAHPRQTETVPGTEAVFRVPTAAHISGGQEWWNSADTIVCVWRNQSGEEPGEFGEPGDVRIVVQKVRRREWGRQGSVTLRFDGDARRYEQTAGV